MNRTTELYDRILDPSESLADLLSEIRALAESGDCEGVTCDDVSCADILEGAYWFCQDYHDGQGSNAYLTLCAISEVYRPGPFAKGPEPETVASLIYASLVYNLLGEES